MSIFKNENFLNISEDDPIFHDGVSLIPSVLLEDPYYSSLSIESIYLYSILLKRSFLSIKNHMCDEKERVYIIYPNKELMKICRIKREHKLIRLKKELTDIDLLEQVRMGSGRTNRLYIKVPFTKDTIKELGLKYEKSNTTKNEEKVIFLKHD